MFEHVLVAVDESEEAHAAFAFSLRLATAAGSRMTVVEVLEPAADIWEGVGEQLPGLERLMEWQERAAEERLAALAAAAPAGAAIETKVLEGNPAIALLELINELSPDLVVAGTHGVGFGRFLLGSVSQKLLERAPCDLLLFRGGAVVERPLNVIVGLDGSMHADRALEVAANLASTLSACLVLAHVADYHIPFAAGDPYKGVRQAVRAHGAALLAAARARVVAPVEAVVEDLREGSPRPGLLAACDEHAPAIAVVGSRGVHGFHGLLVGSTARDLVNYASCPVLVVRAREQHA
jgi:nucleotide-binding universal stress UspA family protein